MNPILALLAKAQEEKEQKLQAKKDAKKEKAQKASLPKVDTGAGPVPERKWIYIERVLSFQTQQCECGNCVTYCVGDFVILQSGGITRKIQSGRVEADLRESLPQSIEHWEPVQHIMMCYECAEEIPETLPEPVQLSLIA